MSAPPEEAARDSRTRSVAGRKKIRDHRDLRVWRKAGILAEHCRVAVASFPAAHANLAGLVCRLAEEVPHEIAVGQSQGQYAPYMGHLELARGALHHLERRLIDGHKHGCLAPDVGDPLLARAAEIDRMLRKLMVSLELAYARRHLDRDVRLSEVDTGNAKARTGEGRE